MGARFDSEYVYVYDQNSVPYFVQTYYGADLEGSYRSDIYLENKSYCVHDLYLIDEVETEGEFLPRVQEQEWREFLQAGPSGNVSTILKEAGLADTSISKLVFVRMRSSSGFIQEIDGFVSTAEGVQGFEPNFLNQALSYAMEKTGSPAEQESMVVDWIIEQVQNGNSEG